MASVFIVFDILLAFSICYNWTGSEKHTTCVY